MDFFLLLIVNESTGNGLLSEAPSQGFGGGGWGLGELLTN